MTKRIEKKDARVELSKSRKHVILEDPTLEAFRVWESLGFAHGERPVFLSDEGLLGEADGPPNVLRGSAVSVPLKFRSDVLVLPVSDWRIVKGGEKILRGGYTSEVARQVRIRDLYLHVFDEKMGMFWDGVFGNIGDTGFILDVGSGFGDNFRTLTSSEKKRVVSLDYMTRCVRSVQSNCPEVHAVRGDWTDTGYPDGSFKAVTGLNAVSHAMNKDELSRAFNEFDSILAPGVDGIKRMSFIMTTDPAPENWAPTDFLKKAAILWEYEPYSPDWLAKRAPFCINARQNFYETATYALVNLGYRVDFKFHSATADPSVIKEIPASLATPLQQTMMLNESANRSYHSSSSQAVKLSASQIIGENRIREIMDYYTLTALKRV